jgi:hypothetical protein
MVRRLRVSCPIDCFTLRSNALQPESQDDDMARTAAKVDAKLCTSPGQRADTYRPSRTTQAGRASTLLSRNIPLAFLK